ncbi:hypothetical protein [Alkalimarinus coralli]|nr:hypothetical protein [Alkalimarinus coralli]
MKILVSLGSVQRDERGQRDENGIKYWVSGSRDERRYDWNQGM